MKESPNELNSMFEKGLDWYYTRFVAPKRHRAFVLLILLFVAVFTWLIIKLSLIDITTDRIPFPIYYEDSLNSYPRINQLTGPYRDINKVIAIYLLENYIKLRETYNRQIFEESNWNEIQKQLRGFSSREIYARYVKQISTNNPESPYFLYLRNRKRAIEIDDVKINQPNNTAYVYFTAIDTDGADILAKNRYVAEVSYFISDAEAVERGNARFKFLITNYSLVKNNT